MCVCCANPVLFLFFFIIARSRCGDGGANVVRFGVVICWQDHETMLKRLTHEAQRRKELHAKLEAMRAEQAAAEAEGERQSAFLKTLGEQLKGVSSAADSVKASLRVPRGAMAFLSPHAALLPLPMYVLYSQLAACIDAHGLPAEVRINGSLDEAEVVANEAARAHARTDPALDHRAKMVCFHPLCSHLRHHEPNVFTIMRKLDLVWILIAVGEAAAVTTFGLWRNCIDVVESMVCSAGLELYIFLCLFAR
jgi:hypothetical protein